VSNTLGKVTSANATLTVNSAPVIEEQPENRSALAGQKATFSVVASGTEPLAYQWRKNGVNIAGATASSYTTPVTVFGDNGAVYSVVISNAFGGVTSASATLTVNLTPAIVTQPANKTVTAGQTAAFSVTASGTAPLTYQWRKNGTAISGATAANYTTPVTVYGDNGAAYSVVVSNAFGGVTSASATLTVNSAPMIVTQPTNKIVTAGQAAVFGVTATGTAPLAYQWRKNGTNITGATASIYTNMATVYGDNGTVYSVVVTNALGSVTSANATLTVTSVPMITTQPVNQTVAVGQTTAFSVTASGTTPLAYQWRKNGTNIAGATAASYTTPVTVYGDNGATYSVVVTNALGSVTSASATLTITSVPMITAQPANKTVTSGQTAAFSVTVVGTTPLAYQWRKNGTNIAGATAASYTTPVTVYGDNGAVYSVVVTNALGSVTSANATLTVNSVPMITVQPANQTVAVGQTAAFGVTATGTAPLAYQWRKNGTNIAGATAASYTTPVTVFGDNGTVYSVVVTNALGSVTSASATLTITSVPMITAQPANQTVAVGQTAAFSVTASGTTPLAYQWRKNGTNIAGATAASYTTPVTVYGDNGATYSVVVTNALGSVTSASATLTITSVPMITAQPANQTVAAGQTAAFSVTVVGTTPLSYQWRKNGANIAGATASNYTTPATVFGDNGTVYSVVVTNAMGSVTSASVTLTVNSAPMIVTQPANKTVAAGQTAAFGVTATGTAPLAYQWRKNGTNISGATASIYTNPATVYGDNGAAYSVVVTNTVGSVTSASATLTITSVPMITTQPANQTVTVGQAAAFGVTATGTAPLAYQWRKNGTNIAGATAASYTTPATVFGDNGTVYSVVVTNALGSVTSASATLTVTSVPMITAQPANKTVTSGQTAAFSVVVSGTEPLAYQWRKNGTNIAGATAASYTTPATVYDDNGAAYSVVVTNALGSVTSASATLTVNSAPAITSQPANKTVTSGQTAAFSVTASGTAPLTYQWRKNGTAISGATAASYTTPVTVFGDNGAAYSVVVSNAFGGVTSAAATLTVNSAPIITAQPASKAVAAGQTAAFSVTATGTTPISYQWRKNGTNITGA
ncbi:MAG: hypothetical protein WC381_11795, partial [Kiritimatiellia bacterium]